MPNSHQTLDQTYSGRRPRKAGLNSSWATFLDSIGTQCCVWQVWQIILRERTLGTANGSPRPVHVLSAGCWFGFPAIRYDPAIFPKSQRTIDAQAHRRRLEYSNTIPLRPGIDKRVLSHVRADPFSARLGYSGNTIDPGDARGQKEKGCCNGLVIQPSRVSPYGLRCRLTQKSMPGINEALICRGAAKTPSHSNAPFSPRQIPFGESDRESCWRGR